MTRSAAAERLSRLVARDLEVFMMFLIRWEERPPIEGRSRVVRMNLSRYDTFVNAKYGL
jgi:hypothetical protein